MAHDVFISYSSEDKPIADAACATLEQNGIRCWIAPRDILPGTTWAEAIIDAISGARVMLLVFSDHSNRSQQVLREVECAVSECVTILPFRIQDAAPSKAMRYFIGVPHWLDALTPPLEQHLQVLSQKLTILLTQIGERITATSGKERERAMDEVVPPRHLPVRLLGFGVHNLSGSAVIQQQLFDRPERKRHENLDRVTDQIAERFGKSAIHRGARLDTDEGAP